MAQQRRRATGGRTGDRNGPRPPRQQAPTGDRPAAPRGDNGGEARLRTVVEPVIAAAGYDLETLSMRRVGRRHLVRVIVDGDAGVSLDTVADLSREIADALDAAEESGGELILGEYELEVSSPGIDRPLSLPRHWRRNVGRLVKVTVSDRPVVGRVTTVDDAGVVLDVDGAARQVAYGDLGPGHVQVEFNRLTELDDGDDGEPDDDPDADGTQIDAEEGDDEE
jgi:ribosome maturation factor RimP